jgi:hypothetical protein
MDSYCVSFIFCVSRQYACFFFHLFYGIYLLYLYGVFILIEDVLMFLMFYFDERCFDIFIFKFDDTTFYPGLLSFFSLNLYKI